MTTVSTVPGAINTLYGYLQTIAAANPTLNVGTSIGWPIDTAPTNWMMIGSFAATGGNVMQQGVTNWIGIPAQRRQEDYAINLSIVCWSGDIDPTQRIADAYTLLDALFAEIVADPGGSNSLSPSGSWGAIDSSVPISGPDTTSDGTPSGWGVVIEVAVSVINVRLQP